MGETGTDRKNHPSLMSSESFLSLAEIKAIKCIHCLRDLILNLIFLLHCWWNYKGTISKKKESTENVFTSTAVIVGMLEMKNVGMVFSPSFKERLREKMLLRSNIQQFLLCWWSNSEILPFIFLLLLFFILFFIGFFNPLFQNNQEYL